MSDIIALRRAVSAIEECIENYVQAKCLADRSLAAAAALKHIYGLNEVGHAATLAVRTWPVLLTLEQVHALLVTAVVEIAPTWTTSAAAWAAAAESS